MLLLLLLVPLVQLRRWLCHGHLHWVRQHLFQYQSSQPAWW
jgi:hypothetical protein